MKRILRSAQISVLMLLAVLMTSSCFFGTDLEIFVGTSEEGRTLVSISTFGTLSECERIGESSSFSCNYILFDTEESFPSTFTLSGLDIAFLLLFADPIVLQLPQEAADFRGTFNQQSSGAEGDLVIRSGLASLPADATQTFQAEPGMQLVVLDLPSDAPTSGSVSFNFNFTIPDDLPSPLQIKAFYTGRIEVQGETYYPPLLPCTTDMAAVPVISVPLPQGGNTSLPTNVQGCDNVTYTVQQGEFSDKMFLPLVDQ